MTINNNEDYKYDPEKVDKNIFSENIYEAWQIDEKFYVDSAKKILDFYLSIHEV